MNEQQKNPLATESVGKLLWKLSLPAIVAQLDDAKGRFGLCYQDNGGVFRAGWVVE